MLGERLVTLRKAKKWTQTDLAELCGVSRNSIVNWETGRREPKTRDIQKLAEIFEVSPNDLIGDDDTLKYAQYAQPNIEDVGQKETESFAYWGSVLDKTRKVAERGDIEEISAITPLLRLALNMLLSVNERLMSEHNGVVPGISAYNGNHSSYSGNMLHLGEVTV